MDVARLTDGPFRARRQQLRWAGQDPAHLVDLFTVGGRGEPLDAQGVCSCGWATPIYVQYGPVDEDGAMHPPDRVAEMYSGQRAAGEALEHSHYDRQVHETEIRRLASQLAEHGLTHREALEAELAAYDQLGPYLEPHMSA